MQKQIVYVMGFSNNLSKRFSVDTHKQEDDLLHLHWYTTTFSQYCIWSAPSKCFFVWAQNTHQRCGDILSRVAMERTLETNVINSLILFLVYYINNKLQWKICNLYFVLSYIFIICVATFFFLSVYRRQWIIHLSFFLQANWWCFKGNCVWL